MKIKVIKSFNDKENGFVTRKIGETINVTTERGNELVGKGFAVIEADKKPIAKAKTE